MTTVRGRPARVARLPARGRRPAVDDAFARRPPPDPLRRRLLDLRDDAAGRSCASAPDACVLWLDAHADFNTPDTTPSRFLGGMCLAGACGVWDTGFDGPALDPTRVVMSGVRDLDRASAMLLDAHRRRADRPAEPAGRRARRRARSSSTSTSTCSTRRSCRASVPRAPAARAAEGLRERCSTSVAAAATVDRRRGHAAVRAPEARPSVVARRAVDRRCSGARYVPRHDDH